MSKARKLWVVFMTAVMLVIAAAATALCAGELSRAFGADQVLQPGVYVKGFSPLGGAAVTQGGTNTSQSLKENGYKADVIDGYAIVYFELGGTGSGTAESLADITYKKGLTVTPHFNVVDLEVKITTNASGRTIEMQLIGPAFSNTNHGTPTSNPTADPSGRKSRSPRSPTAACGKRASALLPQTKTARRRSPPKRRRTANTALRCAILKIAPSILRHTAAFRTGSSGRSSESRHLQIISVMMTPHGG